MKLSDQNILIGNLTASVLLSSIGISVANIALPAISLDFEISFSNTRWVVTSYLLAATCFSLVVGQLGDTNGRQTVLLGGTALFSAGTLLCGYSTSFWFLIFARTVQGIGGAALVVLPLAIAAEVVPKEKLGSFIGLFATTSAIGTASGPALVGFLLGSLGWRVAFFAMAALAFANFLLFIKFAPLGRNVKKESLNLRTSLGSLKLIFSNSLLRSRLFANFVIAAVMMTTLIVGPFFLTQTLHLEPKLMGMIMSVGPITSMVFGIFSGYIVDRYGSTVVTRLGLLQLMIGAISFVIAPPHWGAGGFAFSAFLLSLGYQLFLSANSLAIMKDVSSDQQGLVSGAMNLSRSLGLIAGTFVMGSIYDAFGLQGSFLFASILILFLLIQHFLRNKRSSYEKRFVNQLY